MDILGRLVNRGAELEDTNIWAIKNAYTGDYNSRLAVANALVTRTPAKELDVRELVPHQNEDEPTVLRPDIDEVNDEKIWNYALSFEQLAKETKVPDFLVVGAGLKQSPSLAQAAKLAFGDKVHVIYCNNARVNWKPVKNCPYYDFLVAPSHLPDPEDTRAIKTFGVPHLVDSERVSNAVKDWRNKLSLFQNSSNVITVLLGGDIGKRIIFTEEHAREFGQQIRQFAIETNGALLITNSRRTSEEATRAFMREITGIPALFHDWEKNNAAGNPYFAFLGMAHTIIATGDSISMMFEAAAMGKPLYIAKPQGDVETHHQKALDVLIDSDFARSFNGQPQQWKIPKFNNTASSIANGIRDRLIASTSLEEHERNLRPTRGLILSNNMV